jgi:small subunit ribosomal protein S16
MRAGAKKRPFYRMVAADSRRQRDGRFLEILGHYNPISQPHELVVNQEKVTRWIEKGAQPSVQVASLLRSLGMSVRRPPAARAAKATESAAKKTARLRAKPRVVSDRKRKAKVARAKRKTAGASAPKATKAAAKA